MIDLKGMISIQLLKKEAFTGSSGKLRYRLFKETRGEEDMIAAAYWTTPYCWEATPEEEKQTEYFAFTAEGIQAATDRLNQIAETVR